jgi:predicted enzyme related to lactoylglutathione lyase
MITSIAYFAYPVADMPRTRRFYEDTLGLKPEMNFGDKWLEYEVAGQTFAVTTMEMSSKPGGKGGVIAFEVDDLDKTLAQLKEKKVKFVMDVFDTPVCRMAVVEDPDGNQVIIHRRKT